MRKVILAALAATTAILAPGSAWAQSSFSGPAMSFPASSISVPRTSNINLPNFNVVPTRIWVDVNINHVDVNDLTFVLKHNGVSVTLMANKCSSDSNNSDIGVLRFIDTATFVPPSAGNCVSGGATKLVKPQSPLSAFTSASAAGTWTLEVSDYIINSKGTVNSWTLNIEYPGGQQYSYSWSSGTWSAWSSTCGTGTRTRSVVCKRNDGQTASDSMCTDSRPESSQEELRTESCEKKWYVYSTSVPDACGTTSGTRTLHCHLHTPGGGAIPENHEAALDACDPSTRPASPFPTTNYEACGHDWQYGTWSEWSTTCGSATRTRTRTCIRSDGTDVTATDAAKCGASEATTQNQVNVSSCSYRWIEGTWNTTPACGPTDLSRTVVCRRSDSTTVGDDKCAEPKPDTNRPAAAGTTDYSTCTFSWLRGAWSPIPAGSCGTVTRTRSVSCMRSDGAAAPSTACSSGSRPDTSGVFTTYAGCTYDWKQSGYRLGACNAGQQTYMATYSCRRSTGDWVDADYCLSSQPRLVSTKTCDHWRDHANDPYADARPGDTAPTQLYSPGGVQAGTGQAPVSAGSSGGGTALPPSAHTGGSYDPTTGQYTTPTGEVLDGGFWDAMTNTYWDSPQAYQQWQDFQQTGARPDDIIIMRRKIL